MIFAALLTLMALAATIPFIWESKSLWYKTGLERILLQVGKIVGLAAAILLFFQVILALRLKILDRVFGLDRLFHLHKLGGLTILILAVLHASLVIVPEGIKNLPIGWKFWPEMLGGTILLLLLVFVFTALLRRKLLPYHLWRRMHRPVGYLFAVALSVHIFNVSDSFLKGVPNYSLWILIGTVSVVVILAKLRSFIGSRAKLPIAGYTLQNDEVVSLKVTPPPSFSHAPGQFGFLRLHGEDISSEAHPFTIASAPNNDNNTLQFYIKKCGDWTKSIVPENITSASIQAPFGLFSYTAQPAAKLLVFIAGGIGITPLLSMLRQIGTEETPPRVMLIWSLSRKTDMFLGDELKSLQDRLPQLKSHIFYTREKGGRRVDQEQLAHLLEGVPEKTRFYVCGPENMMKQTRKNLKDLGFSGKTIFWERFGL